MIIEYKKLVQFLDASGLPNQGVAAHESLVIRFAHGDHAVTDIHEAANMTSVILDVDSEKRVLSIELW